MNKEVFILTGLYPEASVQSFGTITEEKLTQALGIKTTIVDLHWKTSKSLIELENKLDKKIEGMNGQVVLIGIGMGMTEALMVRQKYGDKKISELISVCGWNWPELGLRSLEKLKLNNLLQASPIFGKVIKKYTDLYVGEFDKFKRIINRFEVSDWNKILTFVATDDEIVPRNCSVIGPVMEVVEVRGNHVEGILNALTETKVMREFIERK